ncbi:glycerate kinase [Mycobacterium sp. PS03-16]|nr:glycerate kinase [Mycobacterium sp. PS03-16]
MLIAPDKFKGSLTATEVAQSLSDGLAAAGVNTIALPLADGGDGSVAAALAGGYRGHRVVVHGADGDEHPAAIALDGSTAVVEIANTCGLGTVAGKALSPMSASSFGLGQAIREAIGLGATRVIVGLGGSASSDAGIGMLAALGFRFRNHEGGEVIPIAANLGAIHRVDDAGAVTGLSQVELIVASDVTNPLIGPQGAAPVYGPQKGASVADIDALENGYDHLITALTDSGHRDAAAVAQMTGTGAAGGCGFAAALIGARLVSGANFFLDLLDFESHAAAADLVITGEGCLDSQTLSGKLPAVVAQRSGAKPVVAVVGANRLALSQTAFARIYAAGDYTLAQTANDPAATHEVLVRIARDIADCCSDGSRTTGGPTGRHSGAVRAASAAAARTRLRS